jgi:hypothetical protein
VAKLARRVFSRRVPLLLEAALGGTRHWRGDGGSSEGDDSSYSSLSYAGQFLCIHLVLVHSLPCKHVHHREAGNRMSLGDAFLHRQTTHRCSRIILWSCVEHVLAWTSWLAEPEYFVLQDLWYGKSTFRCSPCGWEVSSFRAPFAVLPWAVSSYLCSQESRPCRIFIFASTYASFRGLLTPFLQAMARPVTTPHPQSHYKKGA